MTAHTTRQYITRTCVLLGLWLVAGAGAAHGQAGGRAGIFALELTGGAGFILAPEALTRTPVISGVRHESILGDLDAAGFDPALTTGIAARVRLHRMVELAASFEFTEWKRTTNLIATMAGPDDGIAVKIGDLKSALHLMTTSLGVRLSLYRSGSRTRASATGVNLYAHPRLSFNIFNARVSELDAYRGSFIFDQTYYRAGVDLGVGSEFDFGAHLSLDLCLNLKAPNLFFADKDNPATSFSEAIVTKTGSNAEATILILDTKAGFVVRF